MAQGRTIQLILVCAVVLLLVLNIFQFMVSSNEDGVKQEDVPVQIANVKGDGWEDLIGETVTVEGFYMENNGIPMLISDPSLTQIRRPLNTSEFLRVETALPGDPVQMGMYQLKGKVLESANVEERVYLVNDVYSLISTPVLVYPVEVIDIPILDPLEHSDTKYAVLISGGWTPQDAWPSFWNDLVLVYSALVQDFNYDPANIYVLYNSGLGPNNNIPVDHAATAANIDTTLDDLAELMTEGDTLFFYATDHGRQFSMGAEADINAGDKDECIGLWMLGLYFDDWLKAKLDAIDCSKAIIVLDMSYAGGFTWDLRGRSNRIIMTACEEDEGAYNKPGYPGGDFTTNLFAALTGRWGIDADLDDNGKVSVAEAFNNAAERSIWKQTPTYDDNGDGVPHFSEISNGEVVEDDGRLGNTYL
jgi:hypothetical protein